MPCQPAQTLLSPMPVMSIAGTAAGEGDIDLLEPFLAALDSPNRIDIPTGTLLGAITHFLSTLAGQDVKRLIRSVESSPTLWMTQEPTKIREAITIAVQSKVAHLDTQHRSSWFRQQRVSSAAREWLADITGVLSEGEAKRPTPTANIRIGLLSGMSNRQGVRWLGSRPRLEDDVVLTLADLLADAQSAGLWRQAAFIDLLGAAFEVVATEKLQILDLESLVTYLSGALRRSSGRSVPPEASLEVIARTTGKALQVLASGPVGLSDGVLALLEDSVRITSDLAERAILQTLPGGKGKEREGDSTHVQRALQPLLSLLASIVALLLEASPREARSPEKRRHIGLVADLVVTSLATISENISSTLLHDFETVFSGSLDLVAATSDPAGIRALIRALASNDKPDRISPPRAAFILRCGECLINQLDGYTMSRVLLPIAQSGLHDPAQTRTLEASHAFLCAVISQVGIVDQRPLPQKSFASELAPYYASVLLKHLKRNLIASEQFTDAYLLVTELASKVDGEVLETVLTTLSANVDDMPETSRTLLATSIAVGRCVSSSRLFAYLDDLGFRIMALPYGEERLDQVAKVFTLISRDLPDDRRGPGRSWWFDWKMRLLGEEQAQSMVKAKL